jgi:hypothetical protein
MKLQTVIDKDYVPQVGDVLSNDKHSCITIEMIYKLDRYSYRVNRNYNDDLFKYEALKKVIRRKEIIWSQHKFDFQLFPVTSPAHRGNDEEQTIDIRKNITFHIYLFYNDNKQYQRLYNSKYDFPPQRKSRVIIGKKIMVRVNHSLCREEVPADEKQYHSSGRGCYYWYGKKATPLGSLVNQKFVYHGNIYSDLLESHDWD